MKERWIPTKALNEQIETADLDLLARCPLWASYGQIAKSEIDLLVECPRSREWRAGRLATVSDVRIRGETIRLGQLLKLAGVVGGGGEAKERLARGDVAVNGARETRRGRQLHPGDVVAVDDRELRLMGSHADNDADGVEA